MKTNENEPRQTPAPLFNSAGTRPSNPKRERLRAIARERFEAMRRGKPIPRTYFDNEADAAFVHAEVLRLNGNAIAGDNDKLRHFASDAAAMGAASVRRENIVASLGNMPEGAIGDALRALEPDALQIYQLRQGMNANGKRNTFEDVAKAFRSAKKPGKQYTRAHVHKVYSDTVAEYPELVSYAEALAAKAKHDFEDEEDITVPGAYSKEGRIGTGSVFDAEELSTEREGGTRYHATRDLRNRKI